MGYTNKTPNYKLPQFISTDVPSWTGDINEAFLNIDSAIFGVNENVGTSIQNALNGLTENILKAVHPVGSYFINENPTNPETLFPNTTWERVKDRFLLACGDKYTEAGQIGGEETVKLTVAEMPEHNHPIFLSGGAQGNPQDEPGVTWELHPENMYKYQGDDIIGVEGSALPHNNMPPYRTVYIWRRIA